MPIQLRTGLPGAGKTLGAVEYLLDVRIKEPHRPVRVLGITDLRGDLATPLTEDEFRKWYDLPAGSIIVVDEVQKYLPVRRSGDPPQWISKLSEHRHLGLDFVFITQHPALIDTYVRRLVDRHIHHIRKYGTHIVERLVWPEVQMEPTSKSAAKACERKSKHVFSKEAMQSYTSSELHTVKRSIPPFLKFGLALLVIIPLLCFLGWRTMMHAGAQDTAGSVVKGGQSKSSPAAASSTSSVQVSKVLTPEDWQRRMTPRVRGVPWSAPIFDGQSVATVPDLRCIMTVAEDGTRDCRCYSEQDTRVDADPKVCFRAVTEGVYNPYRQPLRDVQPSSPAKSSSSVADADAKRADVDASVQASSSSSAPADSGLRAAYVPPELMQRPAYLPHAR